MMTEKMKETLERTERALCMHLAVLDGDVIDRPSELG